MAGSDQVQRCHFEYALDFCKIHLCKLRTMGYSAGTVGSSNKQLKIYQGNQIHGFGRLAFEILHMNEGDCSSGENYTGEITQNFKQELLNTVIHHTTLNQ